MNKYTEQSLIFKALSDPHRIMIIDLLSCGDLCACTILEAFNLSQPTLSHHMKILCRSGLVIPRRDGKWTHYSLNKGRFSEIISFIDTISTEVGKERIYFDTKC
ncbi:MAG: metalloregulator ArsR/SmtB family transcription factor [Synergistaceae bacterium]|nr:metalloregulator ArsR/SmtB family transcription factor [Synergistaceae bacterium]